MTSFSFCCIVFLAIFAILKLGTDGLPRGQHRRPKLPPQRNNTALEIQCLKNSVENLLARVAYLETERSEGCSTAVNYTEPTQEMNSSPANTVTAFSVRNKKFTLVAEGVVLVFPWVIMQEGEGYDRDTGVFTAPVAGIYGFNLFAYILCIDDTVSSTCHINIELQTNNQTFAIYQASTRNDTMTQSSLSTTTVLRKGDTVRAVVTTMSSKLYLVPYNFTGYSGHLIRPF